MNAFLGRCYLFFSVICWGVSIPLSTLLLKSARPFEMMIFQLIGSIALFAALLLIRRNGALTFYEYFKKAKLKELLTIVVLGILEPGLAYLISFYGMQQNAAVTSSIIIGLEPIMIIAFNAILFRGAITRYAFVLYFISFTGIVIVIISSSNSLEQFTLFGTFLVMIGTMIASLYVSLSSRFINLCPTLIFLFIGQLASLIILLCFSMLSQDDATSINWLNWKINSIISLVGIIQFGLSFLFFFLGVRSIGSQSASNHINLIPIFGVLFSTILLNEKPQLLFFIGTSLVLASVFLMEKEIHSSQNLPE
jgi:drug/metabolite transporter (DMT)-like permease